MVANNEDIHETTFTALSISKLCQQNTSQKFTSSTIKNVITTA